MQRQIDDRVENIEKSSCNYLKICQFLITSYAGHKMIFLQLFDTVIEFWKQRADLLTKSKEIMEVREGDGLHFFSEM